MPESYTDDGIVVTMIAEGDCVTAEQEGEQVAVAFPRGASRQGNEVKMPSGDVVKLGDEVMVGGFVVDEKRAKSQFGLEPRSGCDQTRRWLLAW